LVLDTMCLRKLPWIESVPLSVKGGDWGLKIPLFVPRLLAEVLKSGLREAYPNLISKHNVIPVHDAKLWP
jgi:hypothetical protein